MPRLTTCGLAALLLLFAASSAFATKMYKWVDAQGVVHYSDTPEPGATEMEVHTAQTYRAPAVRSGTAGSGGASGSAPPPAGGGYFSCRISDPAPEQSYSSPDVVPIAVSVSPALQAGDQLVVTVDGSPLPTSESMQYQITQPDRGAHTISASIRNGEGKTVCTAPSVTFSVQRPSLLSPSSPARGH
jgi:hypothetical protein